MRSRILTMLAALTVGVAPLTVDAAAAAESPAQAVRPAFVFAGDPDGGFDFDIFIRRTDGTVVRRTFTNALEFDPAWSPDGRKIAFSRSVGEGERMGRALFIMDANGANVRQLTRPTSNPP